MERPFILVDFYSTKRNEFNVKQGHHDINAIFIVTKGSYRISMDGKEEIMKEGDVMIFSNYTEFNRNVIEPLEFIYMKFKINPKCPFNFHIPYGKVTFKNNKRLEENIKNYIEIEKSMDKNSMFYKEHILNDILYQAHIDNMTVLTENTNNIDDGVIKAAIEFINNSIKSKITIYDICKNVSSNPSTLNFKFKKETGMSIMQFVLCKRIERAKWLLSNSTYSISEISQRCGFADVYYFSNSFKKHTSLTPSQYRKQFI